MKKEKPETKHCKHCKSEIPYAAKICPQCRKKQGIGLIPKILIVVVVIMILGSCTNSDDEPETNDTNISSEETNTQQNTDTSSEEADTWQNDQQSVQEETKGSDLTMGQKNALKKADDYLNFSAFSYSGLVEQLEFEGFTTEEATFAADNCGADWNEQAVKKAKSYLDFSSFSREGLIEQLEFEGFTSEQAEYGVTGVGY